MLRLILLRHGESTWNKENRFTGWTDVDLSEKGKQEALEAGKILKEKGFKPVIAYTSVLKRAIKTMNIALEAMDRLWIPIEKTWKLNEKHYGRLQGMNKREMVDKYGEEQVLLWRRSYNVRPPELNRDDERHPCNDVRYQLIKDIVPGTEALEDTVNRAVPYLENVIAKELKERKEVLIVAHGNSLRGIVKYLKHISNEDIVSLNIPTGIPYIFEFDEDLNLIKDYFLADDDTLKKLMEEVANQGKK